MESMKRIIQFITHREMRNIIQRPGSSCIWITLPVLASVSILLGNMRLSDPRGISPSVVQLSYIVFILLSAFCLYQAYRIGQLDFNLASKAALSSGIMLRFCYMLFTDTGTRTYDVYRDAWGHIDYIRHIAENFSLPPTNECQAYHPPVHHILSACLLNIGKLVSSNEFFQLKMIQAGMAILSSLTLYFLYRILKEINGSSTTILTGILFFAFHPTNIYFASRINNDNTLFFFYTAAFYYLIRWLNHPTYKNTVFLAICSSLAALSKFSGILLFPVVFVAFLSSGMKRNLPLKSYFKQFALFTMIFVPASLSYQLRNLFLFDQCLGYVPSFGVGFHPTLANLLHIPVGRLLQSPFNHGGLQGGEYFTEFLFKSSLFGEWSFESLEAIAYITAASAIWIGFILIKRLIAHGWGLLNGVNLVMLTNLLIPLLLAAKFRTSFPVACSQDFRYVAPILISLSYFLGDTTGKLRKPEHRITKYAAFSAVSVFCGSSAIFILLLAYY